MVDENTEVTEEEVVEPAVETPEVVATEETETPDPETVADPAYEPSYGYKVYDEEREFDEWAKTILQQEGVGNKELEDQLRGLHAKAGGFDSLKEDNTSLKDDHSTLTGTHKQVMNRFDELQYYIDNDLGTFFKEAAIPEDRLIDHVKQLLAEKEMEPGQRHQIQTNRQTLIDSFQNNRRANDLESENQRLAQLAHDAEMDRAMNLPAAVEFSSKYEGVYGKGSFFKAVDEYGALHHAQHKTDTTPLDAVLKTIERYKPGFSSQLGVANDLETAKRAQAAGTPKGHIPNVGRGAVSESPTKKRPKTMEEFKAMAEARIKELQEA